MLTNPQDVRGKNGLELAQVLSAFDKWEMGDWLVEVQDIEGEQIDKHLYFVDIGGFSRSGR